MDGLEAVFYLMVPDVHAVGLAAPSRAKTYLATGCLRKIS